MELPVSEMWKNERRETQERRELIDLGCIKFEIPIRHPRKDIYVYRQKDIQILSLEVRSELDVECCIPNLDQTVVPYPVLTVAS